MDSHVESRAGNTAGLDMSLYKDRDVWQKWISVCYFLMASVHAWGDWVCLVFHACAGINLTAFHFGVTLAKDFINSFVTGFGDGETYYLSHKLWY